MTVLDIRIDAFYNPDKNNRIVNFRPSSPDFDFVGQSAQYPITIGALDAPNGVFPTVEDAISYYQSSAVASVIAMNSSSVGDTFTPGALSRGDIANIDGRLVTVENSLSSMAKSVNVASRAVDTAFQASATRDTLGIYTGQIVATSSLAGGQLGSCVLEIANNSGFTTGVTEVARITNGQTGTLVVGLNLVQTFAAPLVGVIPSGKYARIRSLDTTGAPVQSYVVGQETQF